MKASALEFRWRYWTHTVIYVLGFIAPWNFLVHVDPRGPNAHVWGILAANLAQIGMPSLLAAFNLLLVVAIVCAVAGAWLRTWGGAYLGGDVVQSGEMHSVEGSGIFQAGPFRYLRNPLYVGTMLNTLALALLMSRSGAIFTIVLIAIVQVRLILGEEAFLAAKLGAPYLAYCSLVPRLLPNLRTKLGVQPDSPQPRWGQAFIAETFFWCVAASFAFAGWSYNAGLLMQFVLVSFGLSLLAKALVPTARGAVTS